MKSKLFLSFSALLLVVATGPDGVAPEDPEPLFGPGEQVLFDFATDADAQTLGRIVVAGVEPSELRLWCAIGEAADNGVDQ